MLITSVSWFLVDSEPKISGISAKKEKTTKSLQMWLNNIMKAKHSCKKFSTIVATLSLTYTETSFRWDRYMPIPQLFLIWKENSLRASSPIWASERRSRKGPLLSHAFRASTFHDIPQMKSLLVD